jgi:hypothetical protein
MAEAKLPYASGDDPAIVEANRKYQEAQRLLSESLDSRKNRFFDPTLLAMAQGFLTPGQTGSFGESLGNVAKNVGAVQEQETKLDQDLAQRRLGLAGQGVEMAKLQSNDAATRKFIESLKGGEPTQQAAPTAPQAAPQTGGLPTPAAPTNAPSAPPVAGPLSGPVVTPVPAPPPAPAPVPAPPPAPVPAPAAPQGGLSPQNLRGVPIQPPNPIAYPSMPEFLELNAGKGLPVADLVKDYQTKIAPNINMKVDGGYLNQRTGEMFTAVSAKNIDTPIYGSKYKGATFNIPENDAIILRQLQRENKLKEYEAYADNVLGVSNAGADGKPTTPKSVEEKERAKEREKAISAADTAEEVESRKNFAQRGKNANDTLATANTIRNFTKDPNFSKMTGILSNDKISSGIALLIRDGIGGTGFSIGVPAIEEVMRNAGLNKEDQAKYRVFLMNTAQMQLDAEKSMKGSTTERERLILGNSKISPQDTAEAVRMKADLLTAKAQFDKRAYRAFKSSKMTAEEFLDSPEYEKMHVKLMEDLASLSVGLTQLAAPTAAKPAAKPVKGGKDLDSAKQRLEELTK